MKKLLCVLLTLGLLASLTGCHGTRAERSAGPVQLPSADEIYRIPEEFDTSRNY